MNFSTYQHKVYTLYRDKGRSILLLDSGESGDQGLDRLIMDGAGREKAEYGRS